MIQESFHSLPRDASGNLYYYAEDFIGSSRVITQSNGTMCSDADFLPFGQEVDYTNTCGSNYKFEGKERDTETGNDNFGARYYRAALGRWQSPDWSAIPVAVPYADLTNPQTLNLYAMVRDNPETFADLDGHLTGPGDTTAVVNGCTITGGTTANDCSSQTQNQTTTAQQQNQTTDQRAGQVVFGQVTKEFPSVTFDQNNVQVLGAHNGHENIVVTGTGSKDQIAQVQKTLQQNKGLFGPRSRINITIGKGTFALHVERVSATSSSINFQSHIDRGNPNSGVRGFFTHVFVDGFVGAVFHPHDPGLDPQP
jgi:RHS repeat-associated protein